MWIFTVHGAYSVVQHTKEMVTVRSRLVEHLEALKKRFPNGLAPYEILRTPKRDYCCRINIPQIVWSRIVGVLAADIDYSNFKSRASQLRLGVLYQDWLHAVWYAGLRMQSESARCPVRTKR